MDYQQRIQEAQKYVDQTKGSWDAAKKETGIAQTNYDKSFTTAPDFQTSLEKYKQQYEQMNDIEGLKSTWEKTKSTVDTLKTTIDKLPESTNQMFGGTSLTQAQRDMARQKQLQDLNKSFTQYNANYQTQFADYNTKVDDAFNQAMDSSNKYYDDYWDGVRRKFNVWQTSIENEKQWNNMYYSAQDQLSSREREYRTHQLQQETIRMQREFEQWRNNFAQRESAIYSSAKTAGQEYAEKERQRKSQAEEQFVNDQALLRQGQLSVSEFSRRMEIGRYR